ncbi:helix-turn-helix domain-containing protein [Neobacillus sp. MM2021_6]|uniref:helix-turn-helix transcriptional regulator n=1 Tax=Bacillaceae TaxID=186817 RepID=UPI00140C842B|nr:helix-turn-helix domain-containing protein [Neobacillus sp. OS1-2]MBO0961302.1 helix-turn-helix domain-containing protein [Neobacillus sp. MM2021_6]NHC18806.1 helix-turn-helix domain-containing protein [Bacillus sp. MM2020_4]WML38621.1 helix-turn-helix domain-containing protein [Neobacillus sp. OS1-2]
MTREEIIMQVSEKLRLIRTEAGYTQDKMADIIGVSKKTLVQIEKGRVLANWSTVVSICALFRETETVQFLFGNEPLEVLETVALNGIDLRKTKTLGGRVWWKILTQKNGFILQQNILSKHFRILDARNYRIFSSFDEKLSKQRYKELTKSE